MSLSDEALEKMIDEKLKDIKVRTPEDELLMKKYQDVDRGLGVGFVEYFHISALLVLNSGNSSPIYFPLCSADTFKDLDSQEKVFQLRNLIKSSYEFMKSSGERYLISIYLEIDSRLGKLHDYDFVKRLFWMIDARHDVKEVSVDDSTLDRCLIHYVPSGEEWEESVYLTVTKLEGADGK